ncbi:hypothetical protein FACS1894153_1250 [Bacteroidia bacterium]|nr:hypothetical protein FACS1894153_1250 [Bacteroidia bacterium]
MYTDPSGYAWWYWGLVLDFLTCGGTSLTLAVTAVATAVTATTTAVATITWVSGTALTFAGVASSIDNGVISIGSIFKGSDWGRNRYVNHMQLINGLFKTDEKLSNWGQAGQLISRFTWEGIQTFVGYGYSMTRNFSGNVDRVDYLGGATFATNENSSKWDGITLGNYININIPHEITGDFKTYATTIEAMYMHEYGHYLDGQYWGPSYLFAIGIPSIISANNNKGTNYLPFDTHSKYWTETRANRRAAKYFGKYYDVNWNSIYKEYYTIEDLYPTK